MNHLIAKIHYLLLIARGWTVIAAVIAVAALPSCATPTHLQDDFGASYRGAIRVQTDRDHVRRSLAGSALDGRAAALLYEAHINRHGQSTETDHQPATALPPTAGFFSGGASSVTGSMPTGDAKP